MAPEELDQRTAAASDLLRPVLARPAVRCEVVAASLTAVHVATSDPDVPVLSVVAAGGARLPGACVLADGTSRRPPHHPHLVDHGDLAASHILDRLGVADFVLVGDGTITLDEISVVVRRWWGRPVVRMPGQPSALQAGAACLAIALDRSGRTLPEPVVAAVDQLATAVCTGDAMATNRAVQAMVGLGPGLTPAADDVLVGALLCWRHLALAGWPGAAATAGTVSAAVRRRLDRTGGVSAALLHHATRGCAMPEAHLVLDAFRVPTTVADAFDALARVGSDTGVSIAYGVDLALAAVLGAPEPEKVAR